MWVLIAKVALVAFLVIGVAILVVAYRRGLRRAKGQRTQPDPNLGPGSVRGVMPPTPLPEWAYSDEDEPRQ